MPPRRAPCTVRLSDSPHDHYLADVSLIELHSVISTSQYRITGTARPKVTWPSSDLDSALITVVGGAESSRWLQQSDCQPRISQFLGLVHLHELECAPNPKSRRLMRLVFPRSQLQIRLLMVSRTSKPNFVERRNACLCGSQ